MHQYHQAVLALTIATGIDGLLIASLVWHMMGFIWEHDMSNRNSILFGIVLLVLLWCGYNIGLLFFIEELRSDHWRSWFNESHESYPTGRIIKPLFSGVFILYLWAKVGIKNTAIAWLAFALVVFATFVYTVATVPKQEPNNKPTIVCDKNHENCHIQPPP